jgi:hypothetical protein
MRMTTRNRSSSRRGTGTLLRRSPATRRDDSARTEAPDERSEAEAEPAPPQRRAFARDLADERRMRASGGPTDTAQYTCACGYVFRAAVSTSVACPHCGAGQAW